jgi:hypothetical protein
MGSSMAFILSSGISAGDSLWFDDRLGILILTLVVTMSAGIVFVAGLLARGQTRRIVWKSPEGGGRPAVLQPPGFVSASA